MTDHYVPVHQLFLLTTYLMKGRGFQSQHHPVGRLPAPHFRILPRGADDGRGREEEVAVGGGDGQPLLW